MAQPPREIPGVVSPFKCGFNLRRGVEPVQRRHGVLLGKRKSGNVVARCIAYLTFAEEFAALGLANAIQEPLVCDQVGYFCCTADVVDHRVGVFAQQGA